MESLFPRSTENDAARNNVSKSAKAEALSTLLVLPASDFSAEKNVQSDIVLLAMSKELESSLLKSKGASSTSTQGGPMVVATMLANDKKATLILEDTKKSYSISKVGTSNALVLVPPSEGRPFVPLVSKAEPPSNIADTAEEEKKKQEADQKEAPQAKTPVFGFGRPTKRTKLSAKTAKSNVKATSKLNSKGVLTQVRDCCLVPPGGSGAHFWVAAARRKLPSRNDIRSLLLPETSKMTHSQMALHYQISQMELSSVVDILPVIRVPQEDSEAMEIEDSKDGNDTPYDKYIYQWISEETLLDGQRAILSTLIEEYPDHSETGTLASPRTEIVNQIAKRLDAEYARAFANGIADTILRMACKASTMTQQTEPTLDGKMSLNRHEISTWVLQGIFAKQSSYTEEQLQATWEHFVPGIGGEFYANNVPMDIVKGQIGATFDELSKKWTIVPNIGSNQ